MADKTQKKVYAFRGNVRQAIIKAYNGLKTVDAYNKSLTPGSGLPQAWDNATAGNVAAMLVVLAGDLTQQYPPAVIPT
jgi:hypothetical protein